MIFLNGSNSGGESLASAYYELREKLVLWESKLRDLRQGVEDEKSKERITWLLDDIRIYRTDSGKGAERIYGLIKVIRAYAGKVTD